MCCAFVGLDNKLYKMHGMYVKVDLFVDVPRTFVHLCVYKLEHL